MKKYSFLMVCALLAGLYTLPMTALAQQPKFKTEDEQKLYTEYYNACNVEKSKTKCYDLAKVFLDKFPTSDYAQYPKGTIINTLGENFQASLGAFYQGMIDAGKLDKLLNAGDEYLKWQPENVFVSVQMALAANRAAFAQVYKDLNRTKSLGERALSLMESPTPPKDFPPDAWATLRDTVMIQGNQFLGYYELEQPTPDLEKAIKHLTLSTEVKDKDGAGRKDPNNYWLRASAYQKQYSALSAEYGKLDDDSKRGDVGKALLDKINPLIDKMIDDYARVCATAKHESAQSLRDAAKETLDSFWKYRYSNLPDGQTALIKHFEADPLSAAPERTPASSQPDPSASAPPTSTTTAPKLAAGSSNQPGNANGSKATTPAKSTKGKATTKKPTRRKRG